MKSRDKTNRETKNILPQKQKKQKKKHKQTKNKPTKNLLIAGNVIP